MTTSHRTPAARDPTCVTGTNMPHLLRLKCPCQVRRQDPPLDRVAKSFLREPQFPGLHLIDAADHIGTRLGFTCREIAVALGKGALVLCTGGKCSLCAKSSVMKDCRVGQFRNQKRLGACWGPCFSELGMAGNQDQYSSIPRDKIMAQGSRQCPVLD